MIKHKNIRICAVAVLVLTVIALLSSCGLSENEKHIVVESSVLVAGNEATNVKLLIEGEEFTVIMRNENVAKLEEIGEDGLTYKLTPVGEGTTQIVVTTASATYEKDIKVYKSTLSLGLQSLAIGMGTVFSALIVLWIILGIFGKVAKSSAAKKSAKQKETAEETPAVEIPTEVVEEVIEEAPETEDESAIVAAIVAAISAFTGEESSAFRIVSFKRKSTIKSWNQR